MYPNCPQCNSNKVRKFGKGFLFTVLLASGSLCIWLGFLFPPIWIGVLLMPLSPIAFFLPASYQCQECKKSFTAPKPQKELHS